MDDKDLGDAESFDAMVERVRAAGRKVHAEHIAPIHEELITLDGSMRHKLTEREHGALVGAIEEAQATAAGSARTFEELVVRVLLARLIKLEDKVASLSKDGEPIELTFPDGQKAKGIVRWLEGEPE